MESMRRMNKSRKRKRPSTLTSTEPSCIHSNHLLKVYGSRWKKSRK
ncbi:hypothetical protein CLOSYM_03205 [[Clostridium] symbiosum ATCC 14940]|uniref:Uncharacterized protein n=1 Tax=[Clostridium] symbiosum ATCC 14940 TaxID=411472 RepID=A0ABC9TV64_CLOSY|nr:hypothetical protein CLOSYM_03205 [[Clostridium] symbiosum ATCC 14940]